MPQRTAHARWPALCSLGLQCLLSAWSSLGQADPLSDTLPAISPSSPPTVQQQAFGQLPAGIRVFEAPEQYPLAEFNWVKHGAFELGYTDHIFMRGLVLSVHAYTPADEDEMADLSPMDMVIGWQRMSDPAVVSQIHIRQQQRFYYWRVKDFPIPRQEIAQSSTNIHLIAEHAEILQTLASVKAGDMVSLEGYLTDVKKPDGLIWNTSRVRHDEGDGACEILLVRRVSILPPND